MSIHQRRLLHVAMTMVLFCLVSVGLFYSAFRPAWLGGGEEVSQRLSKADPSKLAELPARDMMGSASMEMQAPEATRQQRFATYDKIVVEVKKDGTLRVLGEQMKMDAFRSLLGYQRDEHLRTVVTIRPDEDCVYSHIGRVILVCDDFGIPHQMVATSSVEAPTVRPASHN